MDGILSRGMCNLRLPNWIFLVCNKVMMIPSLQKLIRSRVKMLLVDFEVLDAGRIDPSLDNVKNKHKQHAQTVQCSELN